MNKPRIAVYTIAKDEAAHAERWADSARKADFLFWLINGDNQKETRTAAFGAGIEYEEALIDPFRFDDARNVSLAMLPSDIDICVHMDADEVFENPDTWRDELDASWNDGAVTRWSYWMRNTGPGGWSLVKRSNIHARRGYRWRHPMHEIIDGPQPTHHCDNLTILHQPDTSKPRKQYLPMLDRAVKEDPHNARMVFYLAREYYHAGQWEPAREWCQRYIAMDNAWPTEVGETMRLMSRMVFPEHQEAWLWRAVGQDPLRREPYVDLAYMYDGQDRFVEAHGMLHKAMQCTDQGRYTTDERAWGERFDAFHTLVAAKAEGATCDDAVRHAATEA